MVITIRYDTIPACLQGRALVAHLPERATFLFRTVLARHLASCSELAETDHAVDRMEWLDLSLVMPRLIIIGDNRYGHGRSRYRDRGERDVWWKLGRFVNFGARAYLGMDGRGRRSGY